MHPSYPGVNRGRIIAYMVLALMLVSFGAFADAMLFRGKFVYVVPEDMSDKMTELASKRSWDLYPQYTRLVDTDEDGKPDFVAIALGATGGYGAQIRYRYSDSENGSEPRLGLWYWCVIIDETGTKIYEEFNP